ncbi:MAG: tRNA-wybutosine modification methyltransferase TYW3 [Candidatus Altarchaeaceae archaeon]
MSRKSKFELQKEKNLKKFEKALSEGKVDNDIVEFLKKFNEKDFYYTTSSCAGRIMLLMDLGSKKESEFIARWHRKVNYEEVWNSIMNYIENKNNEDKVKKGIVMFKQEPLILHIIAYDIEKAKKILDIALKNGLKHSGLIQWSDERYVVEINGNPRLSIPIVKYGKILVTEEYIKEIVEIANRNFEKNAIVRDKFLNEILEI